MTTENEFGEDRLAATEEMCERALAWMSRNTGALAQAVAHRQHIEQMVKAVEATEKANWKGGPAHVQEREARASAPYKVALDGFKVAVENEQKLRYTWQLCETVIDVWRTKCANERKV